jgi:hypothetical protein
MSNVTNAILVFRLEEEGPALGEAVASINSFFDGPGFSDVGEHAGGDKHLECSLYVGAFNYFRIADFLSHLSVCQRSHPVLQNVQLLLLEQEDDFFSVAYRD